MQISCAIRWLSQGRRYYTIVDDTSSRTLPRSSIEKREPMVKYPRACHGGAVRVYLHSPVYILFFRNRRKRAFVVFTERRWKAIPANENKRVRPATRRTNWRACYGWEFKEGWIGGWIGGDEGARSKAAQHEGGSASQASMFHPWSIRKLALLSSFYRA